MNASGPRVLLVGGKGIVETASVACTVAEDIDVPVQGQAPR
jgi:hypothetical protein